VFGAAFVIVLQNWLADKVGEWVSVIIGAVFLACVLVFRRGFIGEGSALIAAASRSAMARKRAMRPSTDECLEQRPSSSENLKVNSTMASR
jgi:hypothetical protein